MNRYIKLELRLASFDSLANYPGHLLLIIFADMSVSALTRILIDETQIMATKIAIFRNITCTKEDMLGHKNTMEDCGFIGGCKNQPQEVQLYYDFAVDFVQCPILVCDHYFGLNYKSCKT